MTKIVDMKAQPLWSPAPWKILTARKPSDGGYDYAICSGRDLIAECYEVVSEDRKVNALANAQLMTASPLLYVALDTLLNGDHAQSRDKLDRAINLAIAALKMAHGEVWL